MGKRTHQEDALPGFAERMRQITSGRQVEIERLSGVSQTSISQYCYDTIPSAANAVRIALAADVSLYWLLTGKERERTREIQSAAVPDPAILAEALAEYEIYRQSQPPKQRVLAPPEQARALVAIYSRLMRRRAEKRKKTLAIAKKK